MSLCQYSRMLSIPVLLTFSAPTIAVSAIAAPVQDVPQTAIVPATVTEAASAIVMKEAYGFDGKRQFVSFPNAPDRNFGTGNLSLCVWVRTSELLHVDVILDKRFESEAAQGYRLLNHQGQIALQLADGTGKGWTTYFSRTFVADGRWHHIVVTVDRHQSDGGHWFMDGVEVGQRFDPTDRRGSLDNEMPLLVGRSQNPDSFFKGSISDVRLFRRVLQPLEIQAIATRRI